MARRRGAARFRRSPAPQTAGGTRSALMPRRLGGALRKSAYFKPHGHRYPWIPWLPWMHVICDLLIGVAQVDMSMVPWGLVRRLRPPSGPVSSHPVC